MALEIRSPRFSFVQFTESDLTTSCEEAGIHTCLPVFESGDVNFQWVMEAESIEEANALCALGGGSVVIGLVSDCDGDFVTTFTETPELYRISDFQVLYNWAHGLPLATDVFAIGECFYVKLIIDEVEYCSNCFQRIGDDCHTSVLDYGNDENSHGFNYCGGGPVEDGGGGDENCAPLFITFTNVPTLTVPWTASLQAAYGDVPNIQTWIYDLSGVLVRAVIREELDTYPPTELRFDFGGPASGVIRIM